MRSFLLALALLSSGTVLAAEDVPSTVEDDARFAYENGMALLGTGEPTSIKAAIILFERVLDADTRAETRFHAGAIGAIDDAKQKLRQLAESERDLADNALRANDDFEAERALCAVLAIDPFDTNAAVDLAKVRADLRREAVNHLRGLYPRRILSPHRGDGVPPAAERITNDPRFSIIPSTKDRG